MKNCYKIIGTSWEAIYLTGKNEAEQNGHIKEKYEFTKRQLEFKMENPNITQERLEELLQQKNECDNAYEKIRSAELRDIYNKMLIIQKRFQKLKENYKKAQSKIKYPMNKKAVEFRRKYNIDNNSNFKSSKLEEEINQENNKEREER